MKEEALHPGGDPVSVKDENVPFDRCPGHEKGDDDVERGVDEHPNTAEGRGRRDGCASTVEVNIPDDVGDLVEETERKHKNHEVVVDCIAKCSLSE